jgi:hypothetical protein
MTSPLQLSNVHPDFDSILAQLQIYLRNKASWLDTVESGAGQTLLESVAAMGEFNQLGIELAYREAFLETANRESSVYAIARMLGVRISRKSPAGVDVVLNRNQLTTAFSIKPFTQFEINGKKFFNRDYYVFTSGSTQINARLYQGEVKTFIVQSNATQFREIYLPESGFYVADSDMQVNVVNTNTGTSEQWSNTYEGIWASGKEDKVFYDTTGPQGAAILMFGDGQHGRLPPLGTQIEITYAITQGKAGQNSISAQTLSALSTSEKVWGTTTSAMSGGDDERNFLFYKRLAPFIFRAKNRCVTPGDYNVITMAYEGVQDCVIRAQRDIAPGDLRWMNVVRVCILPSDTDVLSPTQWDDYLDYMKRFKHYAIEIQTYNPTKIETDIHIKVAMMPNQNLAKTKQKCLDALTKLFDKYDTLGKRKALSDITGVCVKDALVDYVDVVYPLEDLVCPNPYSWYALRNVTIELFYSER